MGASAKPVVSTEGLESLRENLVVSTPFEIGLTEFEGQTWQLILSLTSDTIPNLLEKESLHIEWNSKTAGNEKWLFLHITRENKVGLSWVFAFDCNEVEVAVFLRRLLTERRLMIALPGQNAVPVQRAADVLVHELRDNPSLSLPGLTNGMSQTENIGPVSIGTSGLR